MNTTKRTLVLQHQIDELGALLGVRVQQREGMPGMMYVEYEPPYIEGPIIRDAKDYMVMLHELGHVANGHTQGRPPYTDKTYYFDNGVLRSEAEAWEWALEHHRLTNSELETTHFFMWRTCLGSYLAGAIAAEGRGGNQLWNGNRHFVKYTYDIADNYFWRVAERVANYFPQEHFDRYQEMLARVEERRRKWAYGSGPGTLSGSNDI